MRAWCRPLVLLLALIAGGCTMTGNPMYRAGTWHPTGANEANLAAEVANPHDLVAGEGEMGVAETPGPLAVMPVEHLRSDTVKPLPDSSVNALGSTGSPSNGSSGSGAATGSGN
jgi:hypothetical protein